MNIVIVDHRDGKPHIHWAAAILLACVLGVFMSAVAVAVYYLLTGTFLPLAAIFAFCGAFIMVGSGIVRAIKKPASPAN